MMGGERAKSRVLLVEDDPVHMAWLSALLQSDYQLECVDCGIGALDLMRDGLKPDLVLLDVRLPDLSGHEVLAGIQSAASPEHVPVIMMSADRSEQNETAGFDIGADDFVAKPIEPRILMLRMRNLLQREALRKEAQRLDLMQAEKALAATQAELRATRTELEEAAKLQSLGRLVASFAHDIGNPIGNGLLAITSLQEEVEQLSHRLQTSSLSRSAMEGFIEASRQGCSLAVRNLESARQMLQAFKQQALDQATVQRRQIELGAWLKEIRFLLSPMWRRRGVEVTVEVEQELWIYTLPGPLTQVIGNLVGNAMAHAFDEPNEGKVALRAAPLGNDWVELRVVDDGKGMTAEVAERAFEPFFTTRADSGGTGLGLDIVKHIVEQQLDAELSFSTQLGVGTDFRIRLPVCLPERPMAVRNLLQASDHSSTSNP